MTTVALGDVCQVTTGQSAPQDADAFGSSGIPFVRAGSLERLCAGESEDTLELVPAEQAVKHRLKVFPKDTVVFAKSGMSAKVGRVHRLRRDCHVVSHLAAVLPSKNVDSGYLHRWFEYAPPSRLIENDSYPSIKTSMLEKIALPLPSLEEQRRIAAILDKADALRAKRREAIAKLDQLLQSVFLDMFGDPVANPKAWRKVRMGELMSITRGGSPRPIDKYLGGDHHWVKIGDATKGDDVYISHTKEKIISEGLSKTTQLKAGSLIFANCGVSLGFARILKIDGCIHDGWLAFQEIDGSRLDKLFLLKALNSTTDHFRAMAPEGTQPNLNTAIMKDFELIVPPLDAQRTFSAYVQTVRNQKLTLLEAEARSIQLVSSLQQSAFSGAL